MLSPATSRRYKPQFSLPRPADVEARVAVADASGEDRSLSRAAGVPQDLLTARGRLASRRAALVAAFDAGHPVKERSQLLDRGDKLESLFEGVLDLRQHAIIHGPRGSGKTSLARIFGDYADQHGSIVIYQSCQPTNNFAPLLAPYLRYIPDGALRPGGAAELARFAALGDFAARDLVDVLGATVCGQVILILDEFDRIAEDTVQSEMATFMKLLADALVPVQIMLVGIAQSVRDLVASHQSLRRHMIAVSVDRLSDRSIGEIIEHGAKAGGLHYSPEARELIGGIAYGSPYHTRFFALHAGMAALQLADGGEAADTVDHAMAIVGVRRGLAQWGQLNTSDLELFETLAAGDIHSRTMLDALARLAIRDHGVASEVLPVTSKMADVLASSLVHDTRATGKMLFKDALAPQFLLAVLATSKASVAKPRSVPTGTVVKLSGGLG